MLISYLSAVVIVLATVFDEAPTVDITNVRTALRFQEKDSINHDIVCLGFHERRRSGICMCHG